MTLRVATFNVEDVRTTDLLDPEHPRLKRLAEVIQRVRPNIILLNELAYDQTGAPGFKEGDEPGQNAARFLNGFLARAAGGVAPMRFKAFTAPVNTGVTSGFDLDNDGAVRTTFTHPPATGADGKPTELPADARGYGNDCWGFGGFPGQYGMALLVDERLEILTDQVRTFQRLPWSYVDGAFLPTKPEGGDWFTPEELAVARLSSKSHWDVPVKLPNGSVLHVLCSHPTPPVFDGAEMRNKKRNHDEIRFWRDYIENAPYVVDDKNVPGGLRRMDLFVIVGDLNADPVNGDSFKNPIKTQLFSSSRINSEFTPLGEVDLTAAGLDASDTA
ncbi:MAG: endonuclease/exonuclease/phosphatase family protein, partial [Phycisphaerales bacterium]